MTDQTKQNDALNRAWRAINLEYLADERLVIQGLLGEAALAQDQARQVQALAAGWVSALRRQGVSPGGIEVFMQEYALSTGEGILLMCLAEALLRIPDAATADQLIRDRLSLGEWDHHLGQSESLLVNAATWGLMLSGKFTRLSQVEVAKAPATWRKLSGRLGAPVIRRAMQQAMHILGKQFVMGETIQQALARSGEDQDSLTRHSYDMLGEAALCQRDVERYQAAYSEAIAALGARVDRLQPLYARLGISVKLSALHPRYEFNQRPRVLAELLPRLEQLAQQAKAAGITMTLDAEESERLDLSLEIFQQLFESPALADWQGLGLAVQAYQKRARQVIGWLIELARLHGKRIPVRLVKGAYWDSEIKRAQQLGLSDYPVFTRKQNTDVCYLACARAMLAAPDQLYCQFASHNAHTIAAICIEAGPLREMEFQRLHGMGEDLYQQVNGGETLQFPVRVYAPVGGYQTLLPYLVRRLLENGANSSFINRIWDESQPLEQVIADPVSYVQGLSEIKHPQIPLPEELYGSSRRNAEGINLADGQERDALQREIEQALAQSFHAAPLLGGEEGGGKAVNQYNPADTRQVIGQVTLADEVQLSRALALAQQAHPAWSRTPANQRAARLEEVADRLEQHQPLLLGLLIREAGKTLLDAVAELREAVDFCRYYARQLRDGFADRLRLPGPTGEDNSIQWHGRGVFVCISPWNFPLAIFVGQIAAALAVGNTVLAKPAQQTSLIAYQVVKLFHEAGIPPAAVNLLPCRGNQLGQQLLPDPRVAGVAFTGSTETARQINQILARRDAIVPLIAETGGQNALIVDSSALPEQVVKDVLRSAFNSAGQRCSALRVLYLQQECAEPILALLEGAMAELRIGDPLDLECDVGPVIDEAALDKLVIHSEQLAAQGKRRYQLAIPAGLEQGYFVAPALFELEDISTLHHEVFGPMLHVIRYSSDQLEQVIEAINHTGYGLTLGIHSRIQQRIDFICQRARVGNIYVNRDIIGAVVGAQPFGGEGLSGTGFKAGGPHYLYRFATERTTSTNSVALGGNTQLLSLQDQEG